MWKQIRHMQEVLAVRAETPLQSSQSSHRDPSRPIDWYAFDATIIRLNCDNDIAKEKLAEALRPVLEDAGIAVGATKLHGGELSTNFTLEMLKDEGDSSTAIRRVNKFMDTLYNGGSWRRVEVLRPNTKLEKMFISRDSSRSEVLCQRGIKELHKILDDKYNEEEWVLNRKKKKITCNWEKVVLLEWDLAAKSPKLIWEEGEATKLGIDIPKVTALWTERVANIKRSSG